MSLQTLTVIPQLKTEQVSRPSDFHIIFTCQFGSFLRVLHPSHKSEWIIFIMAGSVSLKTAHLLQAVTTWTEGIVQVYFPLFCSGQIPGALRRDKLHRGCIKLADEVSVNRFVVQNVVLMIRLATLLPLSQAYHDTESIALWESFLFCWTGTSILLMHESSNVWRNIFQT